MTSSRFCILEFHFFTRSWRQRSSTVLPQECPYEGYDGYWQYVVETDMDQVEARVNSGSIPAVRPAVVNGQNPWPSRPEGFSTGALSLRSKEKTSDSQLLDKAWLKVALKYWESDDVDVASLDYKNYDNNLVSCTTWGWPTGSQ